MSPEVRPKLLVTELWGLGDLVIATPFLRVASEHFDVMLLAKPYASDLKPRFWPQVKVRPFVAPWTAFRRKYRLLTWPWREIFRLLRLRHERFDIGLSARWDPRDHLLLWLFGAKRRFGFPRLQSQWFLTDPLNRPEPTAHRYEHWRLMASALSLSLPPRPDFGSSVAPRSRSVLLHSGAGQPVRVWPLPNYQSLARRLRNSGIAVQVACDPDQRQWWTAAGEHEVSTPQNVGELLLLLNKAGAFIGNDSGPSHLAAACGLPTLTLFGPQLPEWFAPLGQNAEWIEGKPCPYRPCSDYCRFPAPHCLTLINEEDVWRRARAFLERHFGRNPAPELLGASDLKEKSEPNLKV